MDRTEAYGDRMDHTEGNFTTWTIVEIVVPSHKAQTAIRIGLSSIVFKTKAKKLGLLNAKRPDFFVFCLYLYNITRWQNSYCNLLVYKRGGCATMRHPVA